MNDLPNELLKGIFEYIYPDDIISFLFVNKIFNEKIIKSKKTKIRNLILSGSGKAISTKFIYVFDIPISFKMYNKFSWTFNPKEYPINPLKYYGHSYLYFIYNCFDYTIIPTIH